MYINIKKFMALFIVCMSLLSPLIVHAQGSDLYNFPISPIPFNRQNASMSCPAELLDGTLPGYDCATSYDDFLTNPSDLHYWIEDPEITIQGKSDERARQFLYWVLNTNVSDQAPVLQAIWNYSSVIALVGVVLIAVIFGIGYIVSQRTDYDFKIRIWPTVIKIGTMLLYIAFSSALVFMLIQFSEIMMKFFIDNLGGRDLFNIYFSTPSAGDLLGGTEASYKDFVGARDLNIRVQEGVKTELFMLKLTNISYYILGIMLLLRKILLWFLLFVSPFLALLMPFVLIRNTGWIWIGVFFQWLFYGPLVALFLGAVSLLWKDGIPFGFDFSRAGLPEGYVYPTGINIIYGGPAQRIASGVVNRPIGHLNNASYIDTFAEYIITLIMLWAVTFFPWLLLRIFRDYCCDGIYGMKNILMAMYDNMRGGSPSGPSPIITPTMPTIKIDTKTPVKTDVIMNMSSVSNIKKMSSQSLATNMQLVASKMSDIAKVEMNKQVSNIASQNLAYLSNPIKAEQPAKRQQFMNLRSELFARAIKDDKIARTMLSATSTSTSEKEIIRKKVTGSIPTSISASQIVSNQSNKSIEKVNTIASSFANSVLKNTEVVKNIAYRTNTSENEVSQILTTYTQNLTKPISKVISAISTTTNLSQTTVTSVLNEAKAVNNRAQFIHNVAKRENISNNQVSQVVKNIWSAVSNNVLNVASTESNSSLSNSIIKNIINNAYTTIQNDQNAITSISNSAHSSPQVVSSVISSYISNINNSRPNSIISSIASSTNINPSVVSSILDNTTKYIASSNIPKVLSKEINVPIEVIVPTINASASPSTNFSSTQLSISNMLSKNISSDKSISQTSLHDTVKSYVANEKITQRVSEKTKIPSQTIQNITNSYVSNLNSAPSSALHNIANSAQTSFSNVKTVLQSVAEVVNESPELTKSVTPATGVSVEIVNKIIQAIPQTISETIKISETSEPEAISLESQNITRTLMSTASRNTSVVNSLSSEHSLQPQQVQNIMTTYANNVSAPINNIIETIHQSSGVPQGQVRALLFDITKSILSSENIVEDVAKDQQIEANEVSSLINQELGLISDPEKHIEKTITIPPSISLEDYEEVKNMWTKQYEEGEVPETETIKTRRDWLEQEIVYLTNTLNKIMSSDEKLQQQGLDELGYLLPIFLINSLSGEELIVYLKAKLEAAKSVLKILEHEDGVRSEMTADEDDEELVDIERTNTQDASKHMAMQLDDDDAPRSIEERANATQEKLDSAQIKTTSAVSLEDIKEKLKKTL